MNSTLYSRTKKQQGAVSLFIVIFTALLLSIITVSFVQLMTKDQQQATHEDLSESAYDSAVAGVEDAKRLLLLSQACEKGTAGPTVDCSVVTAAMKIPVGETQTSCDTLAKGGLVPFSNGEMPLRQQVDDSSLDQAYTCVMIMPNTRDFLGSMSAGTNPTLVPLRGKDSFNRIVISWSLNKTGDVVNLPAAGSKALPPVGASWPENRPSLLRAQLINGKGNFRLSDFDKSGYSNTLFLYPSPTGLGTADFVTDNRRSPSGGSEPQLITCNASAPSGSYVCRVEINMAPAMAANNEAAFLSLAALYNATDFKVELMNGTIPVMFDGVQPEVDSTGRANDLFRRVVSRIELNDTFNYPLAAIETSGNLCKNFSVTTEPNDFKNRCTP